MPANIPNTAATVTVGAPHWPKMEDVMKSYKASPKIMTTSPVVGSEISDPWANLGKSISLQILIEGLTARCFQQNSTIGSLGKSWNNGKTGF